MNDILPWAAYDWLTQIGPDPNRGKYPQEWIDLWIPDHLVGKYDTPGWVANGIEPWGYRKIQLVQMEIYLKGC